MANLDNLLESLTEEDFLQTQSNVEVMKSTEGSLIHVRMLAYDDLA